MSDWIEYRNRIWGKSSPDFDRLRLTLLRQGHALPFYELFADPEIIATTVGKREIGLDDHLSFYLNLGYDYVPTNPEFPLPEYEHQSAEDTSETKRVSGRSWLNEGTGPIQSWEDLERYPFPKPEEVSYKNFEYLSTRLPDGAMLIAQMGGIFEYATLLMGMENLLIHVLTEPDFVDAVIRRFGELYINIYKNMASLDKVGAVVVSDDLGYHSQTMVRPEFLRQHVFPWHKKCVDITHSYSKPCILHSCGNLAEIMDDLIDVVGFDAKHSYEDSIMPVTEAKRAYGDRIAILGGVDLNVLCRSNETELRSYVRNILETCSNGGYALGSGNSIANYTPLVNYMAMLEEGLRFRGDTL